MSPFMLFTCCWLCTGLYTWETMIHNKTIPIPMVFQRVGGWEMKCQSSNKLNENRADKLLVPESTLSPASSTYSSFAHRDPAQAKHTLLYFALHTFSCWIAQRGKTYHTLQPHPATQLMGWELLAAARNTKTSSAWPNLCFHTTSGYADVWASQMLASHWNQAYNPAVG